MINVKLLFMIVFQVLQYHLQVVETQNVFVFWYYKLLIFLSYQKIKIGDINKSKNSKNIFASKFL